ncbi:ATP-binding protein [Maribacter sp. HTCC2170]|uniref:tetratricopeptide repeat-containing sensor histidine kinase n=1 Tax=Maribacter sp. (strain HTCC2170 / KCCM 42371) TaxID=313603 RepID=UPI00006B223C|nr:ATP-binding protein [Maribacter sp. HTCC2170]EAR00385.1 putative transmembrane protein [Maribacter sp. HTCC2170]
MNKSKYFLIPKWLLTLVFVLLAVACNQNRNQSNISTVVENDSISIWIEHGKNTKISIEERTRYLEMAYEQASQLANDSIKPKHFSKLSNAYLKLRDSLLFLKMNMESTQLAKETGDSVSLAESHWDLATYYRNNGLPDSAYSNYRNSFLLYDAMKIENLAARILYNMATTQSSIKDYTGAEINAYKAIEIFKPLKDNRRLFLCYNLLGSTSTRLKEYKKALENFNKAEEHLNELADEQFKAGQYAGLQNNLGNVFKSQKKFKYAIPYYENALSKDSLKFKRPDSYSMYLDNLANSRFKSGDTVGVKQQLNEALEIRINQKDIAGMAKSHYSLAEYYLKYWEIDKALLNAQLSKQYAIQSTNNTRLLESLKLLTLIDKPNIVDHTSDYIALNDKLIQEERQARDKFTRIRFETNEVSAQNEVLTRKQQIWTGVAFVIFLMGLAVYIILNQRSKNQALRFQQQQQASNQEIFDLMLSQKQKIEDTKKMEQKRISEELHDGVLGKMLGARMVLTGLNKRSNEEAIEERASAIAALKDVEGEVRAISHELSHAAYQNINNFISSIQELMKNVGTANNIDHTFDYDEAFDWDSMSGDIKINLYRVVQETLQNAVKHSECKNILVSFVRDKNILNVTISDDGKGFKSKSGKKGIGMRNIESRIGKLNGNWDINSVVGEGTKITLNIPLKESLDNPQILVEKQNLQKIG